MNNWRLILVYFFLTSGLLACARPHITLDRVLVENRTENEITEVQVLHEPTKRFGRVNTILPKRALDIGLPGTKMLAEHAVISWQDGDGQEWSVTVEIPYDRFVAKEGQHMSLIYTITPAGHVTAHLQTSKQ